MVPVLTTRNPTKYNFSWRKKNFPFLFYRFHFRKVNIKGMFITGYCSFLAQSCTVLPQSCGFNWGVSTHTQSGVYGVCRLWVDGLGTKQVTCYRWRNKGGVEETWQGLSRIIPVLNFHMPKDCVLLYLPSVFDLFEGEAISQKSWGGNSYVCVIDWIINSCLGLSLP